MASRLNTTDFAILGLLARRPWSAYELTQYMRTSSIRAVWPRAESRIYESPKKLATMGFTDVTTEQQGKRSRAIYHITPKGQEALNQWLTEEGKAFSFEYESLLKLALSDISNVDQEWAHLHHLDKQARSDWGQLAHYFRHFAQLEDSDISANRRAQNLLVNNFIKEVLEARLRWSEFARKFEREFEACTTEEDKEELIAEHYRTLIGEK